MPHKMSSDVPSDRKRGDSELEHPVLIGLACVLTDLNLPG